MTSLKRLWHSYEGKLLLVGVLLVVVLSILAPNFLTLRNGFDLLTSYAYAGILACGLVVVLVAGGIDISFTAVATVAQYLAVTLALKYGLGPVSTIAIALGTGTLLGLVNAVMVNALRLPSIIVSIATLNVFFGLLMFFSRGTQIFVLPDWLARGFRFVVYSDASGSYAINVQIATLVLAVVVTSALLRFTNIGRMIYALGGNADAAQRVGFRIFTLNLIVYGYMGLMAGAASLVQAQLAQSVSPNALVGRELDVLAAVVLGGASLFGGRGSVGGAVLGVMILAIVRNGLTFLGISSYWTDLFTGAVIVLAVSAMALGRLQSHPRSSAIGG